MKTSKKLKVDVSWMLPDHLDAVMSLDREAFLEPWSRRDFKRCMKSTSTSGRVIKFDDQIVGFVIYELHPNRFHILRMAISESHRLMGVGKAAIDSLKRRLDEGSRGRIICEVRESDVTSQVFLRSSGFKARRILRGYHEDTGEDGYIMEFRL